MPTVTWLPPQFAKRQVLKFRLRTYVTPLRGLAIRLLNNWGQSFFPLPPTKTQKRLLVHHVKTRTANAHPLNHTLLGGTCLFRPKEGSVPIPLPAWVRNARTSLLRAAYAFQVTWSERGFSWPFVTDTSPKCIDREGLGRRHTRSRQSQTQTRQSSPVKNLQ